MDSKKLIRAVCRQVHPDLFSAHPYAQERNSESLKVRTPAMHPPHRPQPSVQGHGPCCCGAACRGLPSSQGS